MNENEKVLDMDEMIASIIKETGFSPEQIDEYLDAEYNYEHSVGLAGDITHSFE